jgi:hypothetical protein
MMVAHQTDPASVAAQRSTAVVAAEKESCWMLPSDWATLPRTAAAAAAEVELGP